MDCDSEENGWVRGFQSQVEDYATGFGDLNGEFWLGLSKIHRLTKAATKEETNMTLWVDFQKFGGVVENATYDAFQVLGPSTGYRVSFAENFESDSQSLGFDQNNNNMKFSTYEVDNDLDSSASCGKIHQAGWWYSNCHSSYFNGRYPNGWQLSAGKEDEKYDCFEFSEMKIREEKEG